MIEPEVTAVLGRRFLAFLIDSSLVVATGLGVALQQSSSFDVVGRDAQDQPLIDPAEFDSFAELLDDDVFGITSVLDRPIVRAQEIGGSLRVFGSDSYNAGLIAAAVAALVVFAIIPMVLQRTIGMIPLGLEINTIKGRRAGPARHLLRSIVGIIDMLPGVLPGAVGFLQARTSDHHQRLGDRVASTVVVDRRALALSQIPEEAIDLRLGDDAEAEDADADTHVVPEVSAPAPAEEATTHHEAPRAPAADDNSRLHEVVTETAPPSAPFLPDAGMPDAQATTTEPASIESASTESASTESASIESAAQPLATAEPVTAAEPVIAEPTPTPPVAEPTPTPPIAKPTIGDPLPPPPVHRGAPAERVAPQPSSSDTPTSTPAPTDASPAPDDGAVPQIDASGATEIAAPTASVDPRDLLPQQSLPLDLNDTIGDSSDAAAEATTPDQTWLPPREEPAPVWQPSPLEPAPIEAPDPHDGRTLDDVVLGEPSIGHLVSESPLPADSPLLDHSAAAQPSADRAGNHSHSASSAKTPVWSDKWRAWMYWDATKKCWLRHNTTTNAWEPVD